MRHRCAALPVIAWVESAGHQRHDLAAKFMTSSEITRRTCFDPIAIQPHTIAPRPSMETFLFLSVVVLATLCLAATAALQAADSSADMRRRPNIPWSTAENIRPDLGCYPDSPYSRSVSTPNIDELAHHGLRSRLAFDIASICSPRDSAAFSPPSGTSNCGSDNRGGTTISLVPCSPANPPAPGRSKDRFPTLDSQNSSRENTA